MEPIGILMLIAGWFIYILPSYVARWQRTKALYGIFALNLLLGWTVVGWIAALIWAYEGQKHDDP